MERPPALTDLTEVQRAEAVRRFHLLQPCLEHQLSLTAIARQQQVPISTLRRWLRRYRDHGLRGLVRHPRTDRGQHRTVHPDLQRLIEGLAFQTPRRSAAAIQRTIAPIAQQQGWALPSYRTVANLIRQLDPAAVVLAHQGARAYHATYDLIYRRESQQSNAVWLADHTQLDLWVLTERGTPGRPWLTIILDDYSRAVAGYYLSLEAPSTLHTALALHQAIWRKADPRWPVCGIPTTLYTDHGSDFTSQHLEQVSADLKLQLCFSLPGQPRGRGRIERFFRTVNQLFLCQQPGYAPAGTDHGPPILTLADLDQRFREFLLDDYHQRIHGETQHAPHARWEAGGFLPQLPDSLAALDLLLLTVARPRRVHADGIRFHNLRYLDVTLAAYVGEEVTIRYDPRDLAEIRVYHRNTFLCRAVCQELAAHTISLKEIIQARNRRRRELRTMVDEKQAAVDHWLTIQQVPPDSAPAPAPAADPTPPLKRYHDD